MIVKFRMSSCLENEVGMVEAKEAGLQSTRPGKMRVAGWRQNRMAHWVVQFLRVALEVGEAGLPCLPPLLMQELPVAQPLRAKVAS